MKDTGLIVITFVATLLLIIAVIQSVIIQKAIDKRGKIRLGSPTEWNYTKIFQGLYLTQQGMVGK